MVLVALGAGVVLAAGWMLSRPVEYGVTFSTRQAGALGLEWREVYTATLDDLGARQLRIPIYWDDVEWANDQFYTADIDWMMDEAAKRNAQVTLVVGMKVPRWPECYPPRWLTIDDPALDDELLEYIRTMVDRYKEHPALVRWQVENEPLFWYGNCPTPNVERLMHEADLVRNIDPDHPILMTGSGEQALWLELAKPADEIGVSLYRFAWNPVLGPVVFPHPPLYYFLQAHIARLFVDKVIVTELQMEPWNETQGSISFTAEDFQRHIDYAEATGIDEVWLWGVEWWYRQAQLGDPSLWDAAHELFAK